MFKLSDKKQDPIALAQQCREFEALEVCHWLLSLLVDLIRASFFLVDYSNQDYGEGINKLAQQASLVVLYGMLDRLYQLKEQLAKGINFNKQLLYESLFCQWASLGMRSK